MYCTVLTQPFHSTISYSAAPHWVLPGGLHICCGLWSRPPQYRILTTASRRAAPFIISVPALHLHGPNCRPPRTAASTKPSKHTSVQRRLMLQIVCVSFHMALLILCLPFVHAPTGAQQTHCTVLACLSTPPEPALSSSTSPAVQDEAFPWRQLS